MRRPFMKSAPSPAPSSAVLYAGAASADLTPPGSVFLHGYPHVPRYSTGVHDPLQCTALYLRSAGQSAIILANDLAVVAKAFSSDVRRRISERTGTPPEAIVVSCTHTHSGPVMADYVGAARDSVVPKADPAYLRLAGDRMVEAAVAAANGATPAEAGLARAKPEGVGTNRHDPAGPADPDVPVLVLRSLRDHTPIACLIVYSMHPTVLHEDSTLITGDFPEFTRRYLRGRALPPSCPRLSHMGTAGDQSPRHVTRANTFAEAQRLGENLGRAIEAVIPQIAYRSDAALRCRHAVLDLALRKFPTVEQALAAQARVRARFDHLSATGAPRQEVRTAECDWFGSEATTELARAAADGRIARALAGVMPAEIQVIEVGPWKFAGWPGEYFVEYGLALKARSPDTFVIAMVNNTLQGYIVTEEAVAGNFYEANAALFDHANGPRIVEATLALIRSGT